jgi:hypothetical protein
VPRHAFISSQVLADGNTYLTSKLGFAPSVASLGALSYKLHAQLAAAHSGRATWGYAHSTGISLSQDSEEAVSGSGEDWLESGTSRAQLASHHRPWEEEGDGPQWLRRTKEGVMEVISRGGTTAQIDPLRFCRWLLGRCHERGVQLHNPARALSVSRDEHGILSGVRISQDGTETNRKGVIEGHHTPQLTFRSTMHTSRNHIRRMVSPRLQYALPLVRNTYTHICSRWSLIACTQSAFQARRDTQGVMPCSLRDRHAWLLAGMVCADRRGAISRRAK